MPEPYLWINEGEDYALSDDRKVLLVLAYVTDGPAVFISESPLSDNEINAILDIERKEKLTNNDNPNQIGIGEIKPSQKYRKKGVTNGRK